LNEQDKAALLDTLRKAMKDSIVGTYKISATSYLDKHQPDRIAINEIGHWFEHPLYGDESGLLLIFPFDDQIHLTDWHEVPTAAEVGLNYIRRPLPPVHPIDAHLDNDSILEFD
jgi:hypothetical protein